MFCTKCGSKIISLNQNFCIKCGNAINTNVAHTQYLYEVKKSLMSNNEFNYYNCIKDVLPEGYYIQPQINLAAFIVRTDDFRYQNELNRNVDFLIVDEKFKPILIIEINDKSHLQYERKLRDEKVRKICEEAGIPIMNLWTSYGINQEYIKKQLVEKINSPVVRKHNFMKENNVMAPDESNFNSNLYNQMLRIKFKNAQYSSQAKLKKIIMLLFLLASPFLFMVIIYIISEVLNFLSK